MSKKFELNRRTFIRGLGNVAIALPTLEIMLENKVYGATEPPKRFGIFFCGQSLGADGDRRNFTVPPNLGANYTTSVGLKPLETRGVKSNVSVVSGLYIPTGTGPGLRGPDFHPYSWWPMVNGTCNNTAGFGTEGGRVGEGADQIIGRTVGAGTKFATLNYQGQPNFYVPGFDFGGRNVISFKKNADNSFSWLGNQTSPRAAFNSLFGSFLPPSASNVVDVKTQNQLLKRRSILDAILGQRDALLNRLGVTDQRKLTQHLDEIRDLEKRISAVTPSPATSSCVKPTDPGVDPTIDLAGRYSKEKERNLIFLDLIHMAFTCDLTRAATHMLTTSQCHMSALSIDPSFAAITAGNEPHEIGHNARGAIRVPPAGTPVHIMDPLLAPSDSNSFAMSTIHAWHVDQFAYLLQKLKATPDVQGTLLDNCSLIFCFEGGHGRLLNSPTDSSPGIGTHSTENMLMLVAGGAGGLKPGKHIAKTGMHPALVTISAMQAVGHTTQILGEMKGTVPELFAV